MFFPYITGKNFLFRALIEIAFGLWLALAIVDREYRPKRTWLMGAFFAFAIVMTIADVSGVNPAKSIWSNYERMEGLVTVLHLLAYFIILGSALNEKMWRWVAWTSSAVAVMVGLYAFSQVAPGVRVDATLGNSTYLGGYMLVHIFLVGYFLLRRVYISTRDLEQKWTVVWYALLAFYYSVVMYQTGTRGSFYGLIGGVIIVSLILAIKEKKHLGVRYVSIGILACTALFVLVLGSLRGTDYAKKHPLIDRFSAPITLNISELKSYLATQGFARTTLWKMAWQGVKERPLLGWGQDNFTYVFAKYYDPKMYTQEPWFDRTHNVFFDWLIAGGFFGLISYLFIFGATLYMLWRKEEFGLYEKAVFTGLIVAYFIHNFFVFDNLTSYILIAIVLSYVHIKSEVIAPVSNRNAVDAESFVVWTVVPLVLIPIMIIGINRAGYEANESLLTALVYAQSTQVSSQKVMQQFKDSLSYNSFGNKEIREQIMMTAPRYMTATTDNAQRTEWYNFAVTENQKQFSQDRDARTLIILANFYTQLGSYDTAISTLEEANKIFPHKPPTLLMLAQLYAANKNDLKAKQIISELIELVPDYGVAHAELAEILASEGDLAGAKKIAVEYATTTYGIYSTEFLQKFVDAGDWNFVADILKYRIERMDLGKLDYNTDMSLAAAYLKAGRRSEALSELQAIRQRFPQSATVTQQQIDIVKAGGTFVK